MSVWGNLENLILRAAIALSMNVSEKNVAKELIATGSSIENAFLAIKAATILLKEYVGEENG